MYIILFYYMMKNQMRVDATLRFDPEGNLEGNEGETIFSFDIHIKEISVETD